MLKKDIVAEAPAVLEPGQDPVSHVRIRAPSDIDSYLREAPKAGVQTGSCLSYQLLTYQSWPSLEHSPKHHGALNMLENIVMQGERVLRMGRGDSGE